MIINGIDQSHILFGLGTIQFEPLFDSNTKEVVGLGLASVPIGKYTTGDTVDPEDYPQDLSDIKTVLEFRNTESIDVVIKALNALKDHLGKTEQEIIEEVETDDNN